MIRMEIIADQTISDETGCMGRCVLYGTRTGSFYEIKGGHGKKESVGMMDCFAGETKVQTYCHDGFWSPVETVRDKPKLENLWVSWKCTMEGVGRLVCGT